MNENKLNSMDAVGELPELGNLLLREGGFPHLPSPRFVPEKKADAWNEAGTKPYHPCLCQTIPYKEIKENDPDPVYQYWTGSFFCGYSHYKKAALNSQDRSMFQDVQWREVQA